MKGMWNRFPTGRIKELPPTLTITRHVTVYGQRFIGLSFSQRRYPGNSCFCTGHDHLLLLLCRTHRSFLTTDFHREIIVKQG